VEKCRDETRDEPAGNLRINLPRVASELLLLPHLAEFTRRYPQIRLDIVSRARNVRWCS
jgi:DNA-binding transcriptional LysR family regulator